MENNTDDCCYRFILIGDHSLCPLDWAQSWNFQTKVNSTSCLPIRTYRHTASTPVSVVTSMFKRFWPKVSCVSCSHNSCCKYWYCEPSGVIPWTCAWSLETLEVLIWDGILIIFVVIQTCLCAWTRWRRCNVWKCIRLQFTWNSELLTTLYSKVNGYVNMHVCNYMAYCFYCNQVMHKYISQYFLFI